MRLPRPAAVPRALAGALAILAPAPAAAQAAADTAGPRRGSWAAEAEVGGGAGASLLRFQSDRSAWRVGLTFAAGSRREEYEATPFDPARRDRTVFAFVDARLGWRRYAGRGRRLRPLGGAGLLGSYSRFSRGQTLWAAGAFGEAGAAYFFTPQVSLGAAGEARLTYDEQQSGALRVRRVGAQGTLVRVLGTVYF